MVVNERSSEWPAAKHARWQRASRHSHSSGGVLRFCTSRSPRAPLVPDPSSLVCLSPRKGLNALLLFRLRPGGDAARGCAPPSAPLPQCIPPWSATTMPGESERLSTLR